MSRKLRQQGFLPSNSYARFLWLSFGLTEDIYALVDVYKSCEGEETRLVLARHVLVDFDSLDELLQEFHVHVKQEEVGKLAPENAARMKAAFADYHAAVQPSRQALKKIRNHLGAHRTGRPEQKALGNAAAEPVWGEWEQHLAELEVRCDLTAWLPLFNAAIALLNHLKDYNLDQWFSLADNDEFRLYLPLQPPGYYPRGPAESRE